MKKLLCFFVFACCSLFTKPAIANKAAGGELLREWISDSTYRFYFKFYRDCSGDTAMATVPLCLKNPCNSTAFTITMNRWTGPIPTSGTDGPGNGGCSQYKTTCDSPASNLPGFKEVWYTATITLPARCNAWKIFTHVSFRNISNNIQNATTKQLYSECVFNNSDTAYRRNSSPYFSIKPLPYTLQNQPSSYNNGAIDPDADSIITEVIVPQTGVSSCSDTAYNATLNVMSPSLSIPNNPFQTNNTFTINSATGQMNFTPAQTGNNALAIKVKEYKKGVLIGWVMRDIDIIVLPYTAPPQPTISTPYSVSGGIYNSGRVEGCINQPLTFQFDLKSTDTTLILLATDNHALTVPAASLTYTNQKTDSVHVFFSWVPGSIDAGLRNMVITLKDSTCKPPGIILYYTFSIPLYIWSEVKAVPDTTICAGGSALLNVNGSGNYVWTVIPGGSSGSLSCNNCKSPIATPIITTSYQVVSTTGTLCNNKDTVMVNVLPSYPPVFAAADSSLCQGTSIKLGVTGGTGSFNWTIKQGGTSGSLSCTICDSPVITPVTNTTYIVTSGTTICAQKDTVNISMIPMAKYIPAMHMISNATSYILPNTPVTFTAYPTRCNAYQMSWKRNNILIPNANTTVYTVSNLSNGETITACMQCNDPCPIGNTTICRDYTINNILAINELNTHNDISIYPNPNTGRFTVNVKQLNNGNHKLEIINSIGQVIFSESFYTNSRNLNKEITIDAPGGTYMLRLDEKNYKFAVE